MPAPRDLACDDGDRRLVTGAAARAEREGASAKRGRLELIAVVLRSGDTYGDARRLLNLGFAELGAG